MHKALKLQWAHNPIAYLVLVVISLVYILLSLYSPSTTAERLYHLSGVQVLLLQLTIVGPMIIIWFVALWGASAFKHYASLIQGSPEAPGLSLIANGLLWLLVYLICLTLSGAIVPYFAESSWFSTVITLRNHLPVIASLVAFGYICWGSHRLRNNAPFTVWTPAAFILLGVISLLAALLAWLFLTSELRPSADGLPRYALPREVLIFTVVLPYSWAWFMGLLAAFNIAKYTHRVKGIIYRQALSHLTWGIVTTVIMVAFVQGLTFINRFFTSLNLGWLLIVVYALLFICALGFWFIRNGAKKLLRIEAVQ